ncbi:hypothetical protein [Roseobacter sp.]|uniref:hypothetical protein n=1 Tax=Roseobacter sp. TaxID=1907202 RepID=UPI003299485C
MSDPEKPFFVGYLPVPQALRGVLLVICVLFVSGLAGFGLALGTGQDDPGEGAFRFDYGRQTVTGVVELTPYPLLRVTQGNDRIPKGHTLMLAGGGKTNVESRAIPLEGQLAQASGVLLERGALDMIQLRGGENGLSAVEGAVPDMETIPMGRWRLAGEICDGKCLSGAMRPGRGLAHKACANLCLLGKVPPVFVSSQPVDGAEFLLVTGPNGTPLPQRAYDYVAQFISVEGDVERRGDLLILRMDPDTLQVLP